MYAKVIDKVITEFPISDVDYDNGRYVEADLVEVTLSPTPIYDVDLQRLDMIPIVIGDAVLVNYEIHDYTVEELLVQINNIAAVTIVTIPPALLNAMVIRTKERIQSMLDTFAQTREYDNIASAISYKTSTVPKFQTEAIRCESLRDTTWDNLNVYLTNIMTGTTSLPVLWSEVSSNLPALTWV